jgi:outer membrane biosynthesis protein TonB
MVNTMFDPSYKLGKRIIGMSQQGLCELASKLCATVEAQVGSNSYKGGIFPENISVDDDGNIAVGEASQSNWQGQELEFLPPELYWHGQPSAASDVYAVGLVMYYSLSFGQLPFEGECQDAQLRRMGGEDIKAPRGTGRRLSEIIEKALKFKSAERFQSLGEMQASLDSCIKNLYIRGETSAEAIFNKNDDDLSEIERMMVGIIEKGDEALPEEAETEELEEVEDVKVYAPSTPIADAKAAARAQNAESAQVIARAFSTQASPAAPKVREERKSDLDPVIPQRHTVQTPAVQYTRNAEREKKIAEDVKKRRRRPLAVILVLCALLIVIAIMFNALIKDLQQSKSSTAATAAPAATEDPFLSTDVPATTDPNDPYGYFSKNNDSSTQGDEANQETEAEESPEPSQAPKEHSYELVVADVSWTQAAERCEAMGGHLVTINDADEFNTVVALAEAQGVNRIWIGCHREKGVLIWEGNQEGYESWAKGEPSYVDVNDKVAEDYVMLWNNNGWGYNDNRNDPIADYPQMYSGTVGFICEYGD